MRGGGGPAVFVLKNWQTGALANCTGALKVAREKGLEKGKVQQQDFTGKASVARHVSAAYKKAGQDVPENVGQLIQRFERKVGQLAVAIKDV